ncbi:MAG TPA: hypothetical protein VG275_07570 [Solirubrobacteraceae bacterium]|nr:hypothetical protein [Solirubrobacteraceae bacterium]
MIASIGLAAPVHPDFGSGLYDGEPIGIPFAVVSRSTPCAPVSFDYASESDGHALHLLGHLTGRDFEVVNAASLPHPG